MDTNRQLITTQEHPRSTFRPYFGQLFDKTFNKRDRTDDARQRGQFSERMAAWRSFIYVKKNYTEAKPLGLSAGFNKMTVSKINPFFLFLMSSCFYESYA